MGIGSADIRRGGDAEFYVTLRAVAGDVARFAVLVSLDVVALAMAFAATVWAARLGLLPRTPPDRAVIGLFAYAVVLSIAACGGYRAGDGLRSPRRIAAAVCLGGSAFGVLVQALGRATPWTQSLFLTGAGVAAVLEARLLGEMAARLAHHRWGRRRRVVLIGAADAVERARTRAADRGLVVCGEVGAPGEEGWDGWSEALGELLDRESVDAVIVVGADAGGSLDVLARAAYRRGVRVEAWFTRGWANLAAVVRVEQGEPVVEWRPARIGLPRMAIKRALDVTFAAIALLLVAPLLVFIAIAIRIDSPGPVLFGQLRVGVGGRPFRMWKFRTMVPEAEQLKPALAALNESGDPRLFKIAYDPRVTRFGRWLRRTSLDELPQLLNVIRGEMSLVGPRPFFPEDVAHYEPHHMERLSVLPGITGLWQVSGRSDVRDFESVVNLDREYIRRWSLRLDFEILLRTIPAVLRRDGAM